MFEKGKKFIKDHKYEIIAGATIAAAGVAVGMIISGKLNGRLIELGKRVDGKGCLTWFESDNGFMNLDTVKAVLEANAENNSRFAIFRDGLNTPNDYICICSPKDGFIYPELGEGI